MAKRGPCCHCGIDRTPIWRKGPKEKPTLCNACGTRYKRKGNFKKYLPRHCKQEQLNNNLNEVVKSKGKLSVSGDLWNFKIPSRKRSRRVHKKLTPMEMFHKQLLLFSEYDDMRPNKSSQEEVLLSNNMNNFIPENEIGLGAILLKSNGSFT